MKKFPDNCFSAIVTDPPYGLSFMNKGWDHAVPGIEYWKECLRISKPGSHLLAMGGTRTFHRLASAIEDSGYEIRDCLTWLYGSGFPKSHNKFGIEGYGTALKPAWEPILCGQKPYEISHLLAIILLDITNEVYECQKSNLNVKDAQLNLSDSLVLLDKVQQSIVQDHAKTYAWEKLSDVQYVIKNATSLNQELSEKISREKELFALIDAKENGNADDMKAKTILAGEEESLSTALQDIVTFVGTRNISQNIGLLWKNILVGLLRGMSRFTTRTVIKLITDLRILKSCLHPNTFTDIGNLSPEWQPIIMAMKPCDGTFKQNAEKWGQGGINIDGCRIPTKDRLGGGQQNSDNIGKIHEGYRRPWMKDENARKEHAEKINANVAKSEMLGRWPANIILDEEVGKMLGETSRFFYCAKASSSERNEGLEGMQLGEAPSSARSKPAEGRQLALGKYRENHHPTVKPLTLMEYLIKLVMPPKNGILLDPFAGSGTTILAAKRLGFDAIGIEMQPQYCEIARKRCAISVPTQMDFFE